MDLYGCLNVVKWDELFKYVTPDDYEYDKIVSDGMYFSDFRCDEKYHYYDKEVPKEMVDKIVNEINEIAEIEYYDWEFLNNVWYTNKELNENNDNIFIAYFFSSDYEFIVMENRTKKRYIVSGEFRGHPFIKCSDFEYYNSDGSSNFNGKPVIVSSVCSLIITLKESIIHHSKDEEH